MKTIKLGLFLFLIAATAAFSQNIYLSGPTTPESVRTASCFDDWLYQNGFITVDGVHAAPRWCEFPLVEADDDPTRPR